MNIFICGKKSFGAAVAGRLKDSGHVITGVAVPPQWQHYDKLQVFAIKNSIRNIVSSESLKVSDIPAGTDIIVAAHSHHYISGKVLSSVPLGGIGFHPSLLPRHRGRDAVKWAVQMGDPVTGGTVYKLTDKVDGGPIIRQAFIMVRKTDTASTLWERLFPIGVSLVDQSVEDIENGCDAWEEQDELVATWEPSFDSSKRLYRPDLLMIG